MGSGEPSGDAVEAWRRFCERLSAMGELIAAEDTWLGEPFPGDSREAAEGFRYLARLAALQLQRATTHWDPAFPTFFRDIDDVSKWGGQNVDNIYLTARVDPSYSYRLSGNVARSAGFFLTLFRGYWGAADFAMLGEWWCTAFEPDTEGNLEIFVGGDERPTNWVPLPDGADRILLREYLADWSRDDRAGWLIERLEPDPLGRSPFGPTELVAALDDAAGWLETSVPFWKDHRRHIAEGVTPAVVSNELPPPFSIAIASWQLAFSTGFFVLGEDEALVIELDAPPAEYWSVQLNTMWLESLDTANRQTSSNHAQVHLDDDGRARFVVAHHDPGVPNWLDTEGRRHGAIHARWIGAEEAPTPKASVVPFGDVRASLPVGHPVVDPAARAEQLARRRLDFNRIHRR